LWEGCDTGASARRRARSWRHAGVYVVRAAKRVHGMRIVTPAWRQERARRRALAPVSQPSHKNHHE